MSPIDTSDMASVHRVFRNELSTTPARIGRATGNAEQVAVLTNYLDNFLAFLEVHHEGEEQLLFPLLEERAPGESASVRAAAGQHSQVHAQLGAAKIAVSGWSAERPDSGAATADALSALEVSLVPHLDEEEQTICPLAADHLSQEEWARLPEHAMMTFSGDKIWLILGLVLEQMSPEQRAHVLASMPPPAVDMWTNMGEAAFVDFIGQVRQV